MTKKKKAIIIISSITAVIFALALLFYCASLGVICHEFGMGFAGHIEDGNGIIKYNMLSSVYRKNISRSEYYSMDIFDLYQRINEISETIERLEKPMGSSDYYKSGSQTFVSDGFDIYRRYDGIALPEGFYIYHSADVDVEINFIFPQAKVVYWYIDITEIEQND
jgi:hypothetical protein